MIEIRQLAFDYGSGDFSLLVSEFTADRGETVAIVGPSGSGKTTLLNLIAGILLPRSGELRVSGISPASLDERQRREYRIANIGLVFQEFELLEYLSVLDNILLPYRLDRSLPLTPDVRQRAVDLAVNVGIGDKLARYPERLSQGERQRVAVCRAIITQPSLLLADEPTGNLDPANKDKVLDILLDYSSSNNATFVAVTHDHDVLPRFGRVIDFKEFYAADVNHQVEVAS